MASNNRNGRDFLVGAAVGGLLGSVAALLVAPKSGKELREDISDTYEDLTDKTQEITNKLKKRGRTLSKRFNANRGQMDNLKEKARCLVEDVSDWVSSADHNTARDLTIGGVTGGILGAVAGLLLAPKSGSELREDIADACEDVADRAQKMSGRFAKRGRSAARNLSSRTGEWLDVAQDVVEQLVNRAGEVRENFEERESEIGDKVKNIADWASLGFRVWQQIKKR